MKYIIDVPDKMVINSPLKGQTLGIPMLVSATQQEFLLPTNISLKPYNDAYVEGKGMTKEQILNCEHDIINGIVNWDDDAKDITRTYYYIMGVHDMAKRLITGMDKICVSVTEDDK